jgi:hypothetical protein
LRKFSSVWRALNGVNRFASSLPWNRAAARGGFASPDSDYDVRFIYARPRDWYVRVDLEEQRDVIEYPIVDEST